MITAGTAHVLAPLPGGGAPAAVAGTAPDAVTRVPLKIALPCLSRAGAAREWPGATPRGARPAADRSYSLCNCPHGIAARALPIRRRNQQVPLARYPHEPGR